MRVALYARVSTHDQSVDSQLYALRTYAAARGFAIAHEITDLGISGAKSNRPGLNKIMDLARKRHIDAIMVFRFDRFARSTSHLAVALDEFNTLGIQFISHSENVDTSTPMGKAMFTMISAMAQLERDIIIERVNAGIAAARAKGTHMGRPSLITPDMKALAVKYRLAGDSMRAIAIKLKVSKGLVCKMLKQ